ncbi:cytochrome c biogenesis protein/redoxin [Clostridium scatologenes]|uniref:Cytochrome c biogenesis protein transmembrane region n=1 Tax=Clostridium scatologenes TaxID=1548 RepID=A0A0E3M6G3_CLOSL|nr:cytochrome c biogenesis protein/redoxin [Clostridium scatologenes]AKA67625.1 cytochrome c biogenesis protein transmembrane region [Clostridium scatologenes]
MENVNLFLVFAEGVLSLFSPCILPVLPVYLSILSNSSVESLKHGEVKFINSSLLKNTILFVLGISTTFFILGSSVSVLNQFFTSNKKIIILIGGILIIIMGIFYMGYLNIPFLQREKKIHIEIKEMKPITAYILGFTFSFGWTPCVGPMLSSVLIMASTSKSVLIGNLLISIYTIGFILPFITIAIFYNKLFKFIDRIKLYMGIIQKIGGIILIVSGLIMIIGGIGKTFDYTNKESTNKVEQVQNKDDKNEQSNKNNSTKEDKIKAPDFSLVDQYGKTHKLSDYRGKVVFLNFWATWCSPCKGELPHIEEVYKEYENNNKDVIILGVTAPNLGKEGSKKHIMDFLNKQGYTFPVVFDITGEIMEQYSIEAFPTTFIIDKEGNVNKYVPGAINKTTMESLINNVK